MSKKLAFMDISGGGGFGMSKKLAFMDISAVDWFRNV
jgi:hypothetical protein